MMFSLRRRTLVEVQSIRLCLELSTMLYAGRATPRQCAPLIDDASCAVAAVHIIRGQRDA